MLSDQLKTHIETELRQTREAGLFKSERVIASPQGAWIALADGRKALNLCANNYLGLAGHPALAEAACEGIKKWGYGLSSVRFICGTQELHKQLEAAVSRYMGTEDAILYSSCFDANGGLFETLLSAEDAVISDELNHASIIDGIRLCKAARYRFRTGDMDDLEAKLSEAASARFRLVATDGVFSMDGTVANLARICDLAEQYGALVMVDDSHATGVVGPTGRGSHELNGVMGRVDIITSTFGKALGGATGGFTAGRGEIVALLRQRSRPYLFSNTLAPGVAAASLKALEMVSSSTELLEKLRSNALRLRQGLAEAGYDVPQGEHPIIPIMLGEAKLAAELAERMLAEGVYCIGFSYPVVPKGKARVRLQASAALSEEDVEFALEKFARVGKGMG